MVTTLAELAIVVSLLTLSQRLIGYQNKPLGYLLIVIAVVAAIFWLYELFGRLIKKLRKEASDSESSKLRTLITVIASVVLIGFVAYPWIADSWAQPIASQTEKGPQAGESKGNPPQPKDAAQPSPAPVSAAKGTADSAPPETSSSLTA